MEPDDNLALPPAGEVPLVLEEKWLEAFYKECGREVTLAYTTLNQMKNFAMVAVAAAISGVAFSKDAQRFPDERMFLGIVIVYVFVLRFFFRAIICYINLVRWNNLQNACAQMKLLSDTRNGYQKTKNELEHIFRQNFQHFYVQWLSPISRKTQVASNLKLGFGLLFALPIFFGIWGLTSLWKSPLVEGLATFALGITVVEVYDFFASEIFDNVQATERRASNCNGSKYYPTPAAKFLFLVQWIVVAIISVSVTLVGERRMKREAAPTSVAATSSLILTSDPAGAMTSIDGLQKGTTPISITVTPGMRAMEVQQKGYISSNISIDLAANQRQSVFIRLPKEIKTSVPK
jgi:PEGA domain